MSADFRPWGSGALFLKLPDERLCRESVGSKGSSVSSHAIIPRC